MQSEVPRELLGRVSSVDWLCRWAWRRSGGRGGILSHRVGRAHLLRRGELVASAPGVWIMPRARSTRSTATASRDRQLRRRRQGHPHESRTLLRTTWVYDSGRNDRPLPRPRVHRAPRPIRRSSTRSRRGDEDPVLTTLFDAVNDHLVAGAHPVPTRASHDVAVTSHDGTLFHAPFLLVATWSLDVTALSYGESVTFTQELPRSLSPSRLSDFRPVRAATSTPRSSESPSPRPTRARRAASPTTSSSNSSNSEPMSGRSSGPGSSCRRPSRRSSPTTYEPISPWTTR